MENRIKEQQLALFADRTSTQVLRSNQLRLYFSSFAYVLIETLRALGLGGSELAQAQCDTIRLKLLKIGAQIRITVRNVWIALSLGNFRVSIAITVVDGTPKRLLKHLGMPSVSEDGQGESAVSASHGSSYSSLPIFAFRSRHAG